MMYDSPKSFLQTQGILCAGCKAICTIGRFCTSLELGQPEHTTEERQRPQSLCYHEVLTRFGLASNLAQQVCRGGRLMAYAT